VSTSTPPSLVNAAFHGIGLPASVTEGHHQRRAAVKEQGDVLMAAIDELLTATVVSASAPH
jgi:hypothetical protein